MTTNPTPDPTKPAADMAVEAMREKFEARVKFNPANPKGCLALDEDGEYASPFIYAMWTEFQAGAEFARAALARPQEVAGVTELAEKVFAAIEPHADTSYWGNDDRSDSDANRKIGRKIIVDKITNALAASRAPVAVGVEPSFMDTTDMWKLESLEPVEGFDEIYQHYATTFGRTPDAFMAKVVNETEKRLMIWWGAHRDTIRAALVAFEDTPSAGAGGSVGAEPAVFTKEWCLRMGQMEAEHVGEIGAGTLATPAPSVPLGGGEVPVSLAQVEQLARTMWRGEAVPGRVLRFGAAVLGLADAAHPLQAQDAAPVEAALPDWRILKMHGGRLALMSPGGDRFYFIDDIDADYSAGVQGDAARLRVLLAEVVEAHDAPYPGFVDGAAHMDGIAAQNAWAERRANSLDAARAAALSTKGA